MNNKFLNKVCEQIISETRIKNNGNVSLPFLSFNPPFSSFFSSSSLPSPAFSPFLHHCKDVYSLNDKEIEYVWDKYKEGILTIINKNDEQRISK